MTVSDAPEPKPGLPFAIRDRRKFDRAGHRLAEINPHLKAVDARSFCVPIAKAVKSTTARLEALLEGAKAPRTLKPHAVMRGFLLSAFELHRGILDLLRDDLPSPLRVPAAVLCRAAVEGLGNLFAFLENEPEVGRALALDDYRNLAVADPVLRRLFPDNQTAHRLRRRKLDQGASHLKLTEVERSDPLRIAKFPMPGPLAGRPKPPTPPAPRLVGERLSVFAFLYDYWYAGLSAQAHQRMSALQLAVGGVDGEEEELDAIRSSLGILGTVPVLCVVTEIDARLSAGEARSTDVAAAWEMLRDWNVLTRHAYKSRYARLVQGHL
jgi:hypothetical protein